MIFQVHRVIIKSMIGYLKGEILLKHKDFLIVNVNGVGYKVFVSECSLEKTLKNKSEIELFVFPYLKRETIELYGCLTQKEFELFQLLEKMAGIGPKTALSLASFGSLADLKKAIEKEGAAQHKLFKGIGRKRLQRLSLELTGKVQDLKKKDFPTEDEAFQALLALGFPGSAVKIALSHVPKSIKNTKERIKMGLKFLGRK